MESPSERDELLILLDSDPTLWRLVVTWPNVKRPKTRRDRVVERWAQISGRRVAEVNRAWEVLFSNGICRRDGTVDPKAAQYVKAQIAAQLKWRRK